MISETSGEMAVIAESPTGTPRVDPMTKGRRA